MEQKSSARRGELIPANKCIGSSVNKVDFTSTEWVYSPIIQSGGKYDLRVSAVSDEGNLKPGVILASLGLRYKSYCSAMARTFIINPHRVRGTSNNLGAILTLAGSGEELLDAPRGQGGGDQVVEGGRCGEGCL